MNLVNYFNTHVKSHIDNEKGQGMVEYGLILAVIAAVVIASFTSIGSNLATKLADTVTKLNP
ncbi:MAG: Flp family type IVb pilin [Maledivibacter sp.]|nr:Flp family type IVb pilin [Maledivibacter sp.]